MNHHQHEHSLSYPDKEEKVIIFSHVDAAHVETGLQGAGASDHHQVGFRTIVLVEESMGTDPWGGGDQTVSSTISSSPL